VSAERSSPALDHLVAVPARRQPSAAPASDLVGTDTEGVPVRVTLRTPQTWTLVLFLSTGCDGCSPLWGACRDPAAAGFAADETVVVTHGPDQEDGAAVRALAGDVRPVVMSSAAWAGYGVQGPPFFALVDGSSGRVATEGVAWSAEQVAADVARARAHTGYPS
jgi:hypothetical protein